MKLGECKVGQMVSFTVRGVPHTFVVVEAQTCDTDGPVLRCVLPFNNEYKRPSRWLGSIDEVTPLVPATEVEEAVSMLREAIKAHSLYLTELDAERENDLPAIYHHTDYIRRIEAFLARHERKEGA